MNNSTGHNSIKKPSCAIMAAVLVLVLVLALAFTSGCKQSIRGTGEEAIRNYLGYIASGDYAAAWELLTAGTRNETDEEKSTRIKKQEFIDKYTEIFKALQITAVEYQNIACSGGDILYSASYSTTYRSEYTGDMVNDFTLVARREGGEWRIEWTPALIFPQMQWGDTVRIATLSAQRGEILADGELVAATADAVSVYAVVSKIEDKALFASQAARLLDMKVEAVEKALEKPYDDVAILKQFYSDELSDSVKTQLLDITGVGIDYGNYGKQREYPYKGTLAHLLGYVGPVPAPSKEELEAELARLNEGRTEADGLYNSDSTVGRLGLEKQYEQQLRGKDGELVYICTSDGTNRQTLYKRAAEDGLDIVLTVDLELQQRLEEVMSLVLYGDTTAGAVVVMDPNTGAIQAMCSYPSYDLNMFTRGISTADYNKLLNNAAKPLINRVTQGLYPPGSTMKAFTASCALDLGILDENYEFDQKKIKDDYWTPDEYGAWIWTPIKRTHIKYPISGALNMRKAFIHSDNIYFANAALLTGWDNFMTYMDNIGFNETISFDIGVAQPQLYNEDVEQSYKLLADSGYGQGEILVTPLQLASMFSAIANGGDIMTPYVVQGLYREDGIRFIPVETHTDALWREDVISDAAIETILPMLEDVVDPELNGTGRNLKVKGCKAAAKTGTAEIGSDKSREISWFVGFRVGVDDADARLVLVMLEIPAQTEFTSLKFEIARAMLNLESAQ